MMTSPSRYSNSKHVFSRLDMADIQEPARVLSQIACKGDMRGIHCPNLALVQIQELEISSDYLDLN